MIMKNKTNRVLPDVKRQVKLVSWLRGKIGLAESEGQECFLVFQMLGGRKGFIAVKDGSKLLGFRYK